MTSALAKPYIFSAAGIELDDLAALVDDDHGVERRLQESCADHLADMGVRLAALDAVAQRQRDDLHRRLVVVGPYAFIQAIVDRYRTPRIAIGENGNGQE